MAASICRGKRLTSSEEKIMRVLGIETTCDETAAAIVVDRVSGGERSFQMRFLVK